jgi:membrane protease YdiL (CAAX protease family)
LELIPEFDVDDFKEIIDNSPLLYVIILTLSFAVIGILLHLAMSNIFEVIVIMLFTSMTLGSITIFSLSGIVTDWKERKEVLMYMLFTLVGLFSLLMTAVVIQVTSTHTFSFLLWKPYVTEFPTSPQLYNPLAPVYINFMSFAESLKVDANLLYDIGKLAFLVAPGEELVFRGIIPYLLAKIVRSPWVGGMISNALWAGLHTIMSYTGPEMIVWTLTAYVGGFWFLYFMVYTKDITVPIGMHACYDIIARLMVR